MDSERTTTKRPDGLTDAAQSQKSNFIVTGTGRRLSMGSRKDEKGGGAGGGGEGRRVESQHRERQQQTEGTQQQHKQSN